jgi:hypothetical protein
LLEPSLPPLSEWESFYVILGSSAAALTGLQFVVITLLREARHRGGPAELRAFATPTIVHFCAVLLIAALLTAPAHSLPSLRACLGLAGLAGVIYVGWVVRNVRRQKGYNPVASDWAWHVVLPFAAYAVLLVGAGVLRRAPETGLYVVGATALGLLYIGIHNAWDAAVWMTVEGPGEEGTVRTEPPSPSRSRKSP